MKITMILAHPDDEVIFGWPVLQDTSVEKNLLICSSDKDNPKRQWCSHRKLPLLELCDNLGVDVKCLDHPSSFYTSDSRSGKLREVCESIGDFVQTHCDGDVVFTHNPYGEYGHMDHVLVFNIVLKTVGVPIWFTDIVLESNWYSGDFLPCRMKSLFYADKMKDAVLDDSFYSRCRAYYDKHKVWTWDKPPVQSCSIYQV